MQKRIKEFTEGDEVEGVYAVKDATLLTASNGKSYIRLVISDRTGCIGGNIWDATRETYATFKTGAIIKIRAGVESYRGKLQVRINAARAAESSEIDYSEFIPVTDADISSLWDEFKGFIAAINDNEYRRLVEYIFSDNTVCEKFRQSPAAKSNHHAYIGGLLEHTVSLLRYAAAFAAASPANIDTDLLLAGTILHDIGKIYELSVGVIIDYTDRGKLLGHLCIGMLMVDDAAKALGNYPEEKKLLLEHMILSHHGKYEYGSPVLPAIPEAFALHHIDNLDAKTTSASRMLLDDESDNSWTERSWMLDTMLYKKGQGNFESDLQGDITAAPGAENIAKLQVPKASDEKKKLKSKQQDNIGGLFE